MAASEKTCLQCGKPSKYCCPKCSARSCSLPCVKQHKKIGECDGVRDKTAFIPLDGFTDLDLLSDYRFLEESSRIVDSACRTRPALGVYPQQKSLPGFAAEFFNHTGNGTPFLNLDMPMNKFAKYCEMMHHLGVTTENGPHRMIAAVFTVITEVFMFLHKFQTECRRRGIILKLLPRCFTKRQENKSQYNFRERCIYWHVAWVFPAANIKVTESQRVHEKESLAKCLEEHLTLQTCRPELRGPLQPYIAAGMRGVSVLLAVEGKPAADKCYYNLDFSVSLEACLKGKVVVEYPTFTVVLTEDLSQFNLISPEPSGSHGGTNLPAFFTTDSLAGCENE